MNIKIDINGLAQEIRRVDGNHSLGAGALAEALLPFISKAISTSVALRDAAEPTPTSSLLVDAARRVVATYAKMETGDGEPCPDIEALRKVIEASPSSSLSGRIAELEAALKPFADEANTWVHSAPDDYQIKIKLETKVMPSKLTVGDLRRARDLIAASEGNANV